MLKTLTWVVFCTIFTSETNPKTPKIMELKDKRLDWAEQAIQMSPLARKGKIIYKRQTSYIEVVYAEDTYFPSGMAYLEGLGLYPSYHYCQVRQKVIMLVS